MLLNTKFARLILGIVVLLNLIVGIYHLTHQGMVSGVTQVIFAIILAVIAVFFMPAYRGEWTEEKKKYHRSGICGLLTAISVVLFGLSIYHFATGGIGSGISEMIMALLLGIPAYIVFRY